MIEQIRAALHEARTTYYPSEHAGSGFYGIYLKRNHTLPNLIVPDDTLLYIGKTEAGFSFRNHFDPRSGHSGRCTLRRSLGALLKDELNLTARPRSNRKAAVTFVNFRFKPNDELRLSEWMKGGLYLSRVPFANNVADVERKLIKELAPPLNLKGCTNPQAERVKALRRQCVIEARNQVAN